VDADTIIAKEGDYAVKGECNQIQRITKEYRDPARKCQRCHQKTWKVLPVISRQQRHHQKLDNITDSILAWFIYQARIRYSQKHPYGEERPDSDLKAVHELHLSLARGNSSVSETPHRRYLEELPTQIVSRRGKYE
jgi:hypothetical protein